MSIYVRAGPWEPDRPALLQDGGVLRKLTNMIHENGVYCAAPAFTSGSEAPGGEDSHPPYRHIETFDSSRAYAAPTVVMTDTHLGHLSGESTIDIDGPHGLTGTETVQARAFGDKAVFATLTGGVAALDLRNFDVEAWPSERPLGGVVGIIGDRLALGRIRGRESTMRLSAINDLTTWDGPGADDLSFAEGGRVQAIVSGSPALVFLETAIYRVHEAEYPFKHTKETVATHLGLYGANSSFAVGNAVYFASEHGFHAISREGGAIVPIGHGRVDRFFLSRVAHNLRDETICFHDAGRRQVIWAYRPAVDPTTRHCLAYAYNEDRWGHFVPEDAETGEPFDLQAAAAARRPPAFADGDTRTSDAPPVAATLADSAIYGGGGLELRALTAAGLRGFAERPCSTFGATTSGADVSVLYDAGPPDGRERRPPPSDERPALGDETHINEVLVNARLDYGPRADDPPGTPAPSVVVRLYPDLDEDAAVESTVSPVDPRRGIAPINARARQFAVGFEARGQRRPCSFSGFIVRPRRGGQ